jgi:acetyltransferase-like isoleucine patch superfamily enzyme
MKNKFIKKLIFYSKLKNTGYLLKWIRKKITGKPIYFIHKTAIIEDKNIELRENAQIWEHVIIRKSENKIIIKENAQIGPFTVIFGGDDVIIGKNVMIAPHCVISAANHNYKQTEKPMRDIKSISSGPIIIEDNAWIGANSTITDGVTIGKEAVVAANSVVTKNVAPYSIVAGAPAKPIGDRLKLTHSEKKYD